MAQPKPVQQPAHRGTVDMHVAFCKVYAQLIKRQIAVLGYPLANPIPAIAKLADPRPATLRLRRQTARIALQNNHVVDEAR